MHHELVCHQKHWPKLPYTNTREVHLKVCFREECFWATICYVSAVKYSIKLQSVCEEKLGAWGLKTRFDMVKF